LGPAKWSYYYLYVILDIFSRYVVGWMVASVESAELAKKLIAGTCSSQRINRDTLTIHADRGSSMASKPVAHLLADLGVTKSHSRPHVSNDNPFSKAQFKTFKYRPDFPGHFGSIEDARAHCRRFFSWYNFDHRHAGIALLTPADVHHGRATEVVAARAHVLINAYAANPERFVRKPPAPPVLSAVSWINKPTEEREAAARQFCEHGASSGLTSSAGRCHVRVQQRSIEALSEQLSAMAAGAGRAGHRAGRRSDRRRVPRHRVDVSRSVPLPCASVGARGFVSW